MSFLFKDSSFSPKSPDSGLFARFAKPRQEMRLPMFPSRERDRAPQLRERASLRGTQLTGLRSMDTPVARVGIGRFLGGLAKGTLELVSFLVRAIIATAVGLTVGVLAGIGAATLAGPQGGFAAFLIVGVLAACIVMKSLGHNMGVGDAF